MVKFNLSNWALGYEGVENFGDIQLTQGAVVDASGEGGGAIQVQGRQVSVQDGSQIQSESRKKADLKQLNKGIANAAVGNAMFSVCAFDLGGGPKVGNQIE